MNKAEYPAKTGFQHCFHLYYMSVVGFFTTVFIIKRNSRCVEGEIDDDSKQMNREKSYYRTRVDESILLPHPWPMLSLSPCSQCEGNNDKEYQEISKTSSSLVNDRFHPRSSALSPIDQTRVHATSTALPTLVVNPIILQEEQEQNRRQLLRSRQTVRKMEQDSCPDKLSNRYEIDWAHPLGEGSFGVVYLGIDRHSKEAVAVKQISKTHTAAHHLTLQAEMRALLHLRDSGGHPNICSLRETFSEDDGYYYLILDLVVGGELFDHLVSQGAYSEADAARLVREVASALAYLHGAGPGMIHGDLKPENIMLSSSNPSDAVIKLIDFGCAVVLPDNSAISRSNENDNEAWDDDSGPIRLTGRTLAYSPPEILNQSQTTLDPSADMWALVSF